MHYTDALNYLYSLTNYERVHLNVYSPRTLDLSRMTALLAKLGNPHQRFRSIHVAGTKGKGSTCAILASCLKQLGVRAGLYTSPHLSSFRERIRVDGELISPEQVAELTQQVKAAAEHIPGVTTFEAVTALAFLHFAQSRVPWAVIEVGLGGRLDATNVILPEISVITSISYDHTQILGSSLSQIAAEKCGIIKPSVPVVSQSQHLEAMAVIEQVAHDRNAPLTVIGRHWRWSSGARVQAKQSFELKKVAQPRTNEHPFVNDLEGHYEIPLLGLHQIENAATAVATLDVLRESLVDSGMTSFSPRAVREGVRTTQWPGRFEILRTDPPVIVDGAHNVDSANKLAATLAEVFPGRRWVFVFGTLKDKDTEGMINALSPRALRWIVSQPTGNPRAQSAEVLAEVLRNRNARMSVAHSLAEAMDAVISSADPVCITGSLAFVGEARECWAEKTGAALPFVADRLTDECFTR